MEEAAGVALGVVPLLVAAVQHYDDILRPFETYKCVHTMRVLY